MAWQHSISTELLWACLTVPDNKKTYRKTNHFSTVTETWLKLTPNYIFVASTGSTWDIWKHWRTDAEIFQCYGKSFDGSLNYSDESSSDHWRQVVSSLHFKLQVLVQTKRGPYFTLMSLVPSVPPVIVVLVVRPCWLASHPKYLTWFLHGEPAYAPKKPIARAILTGTLSSVQQWTEVGHKYNSRSRNLQGASCSQRVWLVAWRT